MKKKIKIIIILILIFLNCIIIINNKEKLAYIISVKCLVVKSGSMQPVLNIGDIIIINKQNDYKVGDIVTYNVNNDYFVTHRIIYKNNIDFTTKGDYNNCEDKEHIQIENIEGKVIFIINSRMKNMIITSFFILIIYILWKENKK